jgi:RND superfamily putative drug exporter
MNPHRNIAARAGAWSARHRRKAILGWLAFVVIATLLGGSIGTKTLEPEDLGNGQSQVADRAIAAAGFASQADEQVLVQGRAGVRAGDPAFAAAVRDVARRLEAVPHVKDVTSPWPRCRWADSRDGRSGLVTFAIAATTSRSPTASPRRRRRPPPPAAHPAVRVEQFGGASANEALSEAFADDFERAEGLSLPITLVILVVAFGRSSRRACRSCSA